MHLSVQIYKTHPNCWPGLRLLRNQSIFNKIWLWRATGAIWCQAHYLSQVRLRCVVCRPGGYKLFQYLFCMSELTLQDHEAVTQVYPEITNGK